MQDEACPAPEPSCPRGLLALKGEGVGRGVSGFGFRVSGGFGFLVTGVWLRALGFKIWVSGKEFGFQGLGFRFQDLDLGERFEVSEFGFRGQDLEWEGAPPLPPPPQGCRS